MVETRGGMEEEGDWPVAGGWGVVAEKQQKRRKDYGEPKRSGQGTPNIDSVSIGRNLVFGYRRIYSPRLSCVFLKEEKKLHSSKPSRLKTRSHKKNQLFCSI
jgi:hypothetical protein